MNPAAPLPAPPLTKKSNLLKYLFALCYCLLLIGFILFLVLFILAASGALSGKSVPVKDLQRFVSNRSDLPDSVKNDFLNLLKKA
jgi:hypothetical protein